jgi:hypothetical protein
MAELLVNRMRTAGHRYTRHRSMDILMSYCFYWITRRMDVKDSRQEMPLYSTRTRTALAYAWYDILHTERDVPIPGSVYLSHYTATLWNADVD